MLAALGWTRYLSQQTANHRGRADVPDFLFFASPEAKKIALAETQPDRRYRHGSLSIDAKRWQRPLDRGDNAAPLDTGTPSSPMLR